MSAPVTTSRIDWRGVAISICYRMRRWGSEFDHLEVKVIGDGDIPITETGYRSHFLPMALWKSSAAPKLTSRPGWITKRSPRSGRNAPSQRGSFLCSKNEANNLVNLINIRTPHSIVFF